MHACMIWGKLSLSRRKGRMGKGKISISAFKFVSAKVAWGYYVGVEYSTLFSNMLTHAGKVTWKYPFSRFPSQGVVFRTPGAKGCFDHRLRARPVYTTQLPTLYQLRADNQYRMANELEPTLRIAAVLRQRLKRVCYPSNDRALHCLTLAIRSYRN